MDNDSAHQRQMLVQVELAKKRKEHQRVRFTSHAELKQKKFVRRKRTLKQSDEGSR